MEKKVGETKILKKEHERTLKNLSPPPTNVIFTFCFVNQIYILFCKLELTLIPYSCVKSEEQQRSVEKLLDAKMH